MAASVGCQLSSYFSIFLRTGLQAGALIIAKNPNLRDFDRWFTDLVGGDGKVRLADMTCNMETSAKRTQWQSISSLAGSMLTGGGAV